jgi:hypothetical protein
MLRTTMGAAVAAVIDDVEVRPLGVDSIEFDDEGAPP